MCDGVVRGGRAAAGAVDAGPEPQVNDALTTAFAYLLLPQVLAYGLTSVFMQS